MTNTSGDKVRHNHASTDRPKMRWRLRTTAICGLIAASLLVGLKFAMTRNNVVLGASHDSLCGSSSTWRWNAIEVQNSFLELHPAKLRVSIFTCHSDNCTFDAAHAGEAVANLAAQFGSSVQSGGAFVIFEKTKHIQTFWPRDFNWNLSSDPVSDYQRHEVPRSHATTSYAIDAMMPARGWPRVALSLQIDESAGQPPQVRLSKSPELRSWRFGFSRIRALKKSAKTAQAMAAKVENSDACFFHLLFQPAPSLVAEIAAQLTAWTSRLLGIAGLQPNANALAKFLADDWTVAERRPRIKELLPLVFPMQATSFKDMSFVAIHPFSANVSASVDSFRYCGAAFSGFLSHSFRPAYNILVGSWADGELSTDQEAAFDWKLRFDESEIKTMSAMILASMADVLVATRSPTSRALEILGFFGREETLHWSEERMEDDDETRHVIGIDCAGFTNLAEGHAAATTELQRV